MRLVEQAKEDIYFAQKDRELIAKLKEEMKKVDKPGEGGQQLVCPKCQGTLQSYVFMEIFLDRCQGCGGLWLDQGELERILKKIPRGPLTSLIDRLLPRRGEDTYGGRIHP
jgi:Zn-finger nucleic acid-binding protein